MTSSGQIRLSDVRRMLKECAPGHVWTEKLHRIHVTYGTKAYRNLPTGAHKSKGHVERPYVRKLAQVLGILDCAKREIASL